MAANGSTEMILNPNGQMILNANNSDTKKNHINYEEIRKYLMKDLKSQKQPKVGLSQ